MSRMTVHVLAFRTRNASETDCNTNSFVLFVIHYSFDLRFNDVDVVFVLGSFCLGLGHGHGLGLERCCLDLGLWGLMSWSWS